MMKSVEGWVCGIGGSRRQLMRLCLLCCGLASSGCMHASVGKVRKADTKLCVENMVVVVEVVENVGNRHIIEPLRGHLQARGVIGHMVDVQSIVDLRHPSISGAIGEHNPQAVLVVDWVNAGLFGSGGLATMTNSENNFKLSLYEYTAQHNLVEIWKTKLRSARGLTVSTGLEPKEGEEIALEIVEELAKSKLIAPCDDFESEEN